MCSNCKWSALRTAALDALSNIASEVSLFELYFFCLLVKGMGGRGVISN